MSRHESKEFVVINTFPLRETPSKYLGPVQSYVALSASLLEMNPPVVRRRLVFWALYKGPNLHFFHVRHLALYCLCQLVFLISIKSVCECIVNVLVNYHHMYGTSSLIDLCKRFDDIQLWCL